MAPGRVAGAEPGAAELEGAGAVRHGGPVPALHGPKARQVTRAGPGPKAARETCHLQ